MSADPLRPHSHDNNTVPPSADTWIILKTPAIEQTLTIAELAALPETSIEYTYTTDHGKHGPYILQGVKLLDLIAIHGKYDQCDVSHIEIISADGFGNRIDWAEISAENHTNPILIYLKSNDLPLTLVNGLPRLVVPSETDNALRQIKWVRHINVVPKSH